MGKIGNVREIPVAKLRPYDRNARVHSAEQVQQIAESIREFGFLNPLLIDKAGNVIAGHGRLEAAKVLGMDKVPALYVEGLSEEQRRAYVIADNRLTELGGWDMQIVVEELQALNLDGFNVDVTGFELPKQADAEDFFENRERWTQGKQAENDEYNAFVEKFEPKRTTDDCYTPDNIYNAVADWVAKEYGLDKANFVRPFYPGGDYQRDAESYGPDVVVVDNPPFSILAEICRFYMARGIKFWLFAPTLTLFSADEPGITHVCATCKMTFENGANINASFKTNLEPETALRTCPDLTAEVCRLDKESQRKDTHPKYTYPWNCLTAAKVGAWSQYGVLFKVPRAECRKITELDAQKEQGAAIFGGGFLVSDNVAAQAAQAAQAAGINAALLGADGAVVWELSERERAIVEELGRA